MNLLLVDPLGGPGLHSGYQQLLRAFPEDAAVRSIWPGTGFRDRLIGKLYSLAHRWPERNQLQAAAEFHFARALRQPVQAAHILVGEYHLLFVALWQKMPRHVMATFHFPPRQWSPEKRDGLRRFSSALVLYRRDLDFFEEHVGAGRVRFVRLGVWTDFFSPDDRPVPREQARLLFAGQYLRNAEMMHRAVVRLHRDFPDLRFDLVVPEKYRERPGFRELQNHPAVQWHAGLSDEELRELYRRAYLHLLPMDDSGANTAITESLACGTPVVTTDVGGIRDYGGGSVFPVVANNDDDALCELVSRYLASPEWRDEMGRAVRGFAEEHLAWPVVARAHLEAYAELTA